MIKLHTLFALRGGVKNRRVEELKLLHRDSQRADLYEGLTRTYQPNDEEGDRLPDETKLIQLNADNVLNRLVETVRRDWNLMASIDVGNQRARADVTVPTGAVTSTGEPVQRVLLRDVPAQFLLFLARELDDVYTFVRKLPTLDPAHTWRYDDAVAASVTEPIQTHRTTKTLNNHVLYPATDKHPAQVQTFTTDKIVGYWTQIKQSGALTLERKALLLQRVDTLRLAVKEARERANEVETDDVEVVRPLFDYLLSDER